MTNYQNGKIYKIVCKDHIYTHDLEYYGATCNDLRKVLFNHKEDYLKNSKTTFKKFYKLFECGTPKIYLVENFPCNNKQELNSKLSEYFDCGVNHSPIVTKDWFPQTKEERKQKQKEYYEKNKEKINARRRELRKLKKDKINL